MEKERKQIQELLDKIDSDIKLRYLRIIIEDVVKEN